MYVGIFPHHPTSVEHQLQHKRLLDYALLTSSTFGFVFDKGKKARVDYSDYHGLSNTISYLKVKYGSARGRLARDQ